MTTKQILGVKFFCGSAPEAVAQGLQGGLVVVPSAPVLVEVADKPALREAVLGADLAIPDSGLMVLLWWLLKQEKLERVSGLEYLKLLLERLRTQPQISDESYSLLGSAQHPITSNPQPITENASGVFWVMPTVAARDQNLAWLRSQGFETTVADCYVAPKYAAEGPLSDDTLLSVIRDRKPAHIILALGGGVQERLGFALKQNLEKPETGNLKPEGSDPKASASSTQVSGFRSQVSAGAAYRPGIHCIGAAIGFLSGEQVEISMWVDYLYLGWLWRSVSSPTKFLPRYWKATRLVGLMVRYGAKAPGVKDAET